jgi:hypothetical protein
MSVAFRSKHGRTEVPDPVRPELARRRQSKKYTLPLYAPPDE